MSLREDLKEFIPKYLWEELKHPEGFLITNEEFNDRWNLIRSQGDQQARTIRDILLMLYETVLHDIDGASHIRVDLPEYSEVTLKDVLVRIDTRIKANVNALTAHKISGDHDHRYYTKLLLDSGALNKLYYTKEELLPWLRGGDTIIREEVFVIINPDNGDGTFTYTSKDEIVFGEITGEGYLVFELVTGFYDLGDNRIEVIINDTLRRSVVSGGIVEISPTQVALTDTEESGTEITVRYYERLGVTAEYNIKLSVEKPPYNHGKTMWFEITGEVGQ